MSSTHEKIRLLIGIINNLNVQGLEAFVDVFYVPILVGSCSEKHGVSSTYTSYTLYIDIDIYVKDKACQQEFNHFQERFEGACVDDYTVGDLLVFCVKKGKSIYPNMARAARVLLSVPASSAVLERD